MYAGGLSLWWYRIHSAADPRSGLQSVIGIHEDGAAELGCFAVLEGELPSTAVARIAGSIWERVERNIQSAASFVERDPAGVSLRLSRDEDWTLTMAFALGTVRVSPGDRGRWRLFSGGLGASRNALTCLRQLPDAQVREAQMPGTGERLIPLGGGQLQAAADALARLADPGAARICAVVRGLQELDAGEAASCSRCGKAFQRRATERWKDTCRDCYRGTREQGAAAPVSAGAAMGSAMAPPSPVEAPEVASGLLLAINERLRGSGERLRKGVLVPWVVVDMETGAVTRPNIQSLESLAGAIGLKSG